MTTKKMQLTDMAWNSLTWMKKIRLFYTPMFTNRLLISWKNNPEPVKSCHCSPKPHTHYAFQTA